MKVFSDDALDALAAGDILVGGAVEILSDPVMRIFAGYGTLTIEGETYAGVGNQQLVTQVGASIGGSAQGTTLELSGVDPDIAPLVNYASAKDAICTLWRVFFNGAGTVLLDAHVFSRGRLDTLEWSEEAGGTSTLTANVESAARALGRRGGRLRSDADQRLISSTDGGFKAVSFAGEKMLYWGGRPPTGGSSAFTGVLSGLGFG